MHTQGLSRKMQYTIVLSEGSWILHYFSGEDLELWQENLSVLLLFKGSCNMEMVRGGVPVYKQYCSLYPNHGKKKKKSSA